MNTNLKQNTLRLIIFGSILVLGCRTIDTASKTDTETQNFRTPEQISKVVKSIQTQNQEYKISTLDLLDISVYGENLGKTVRVSQNGEITFPLIGAVKVVGLTVPEIEQRIAFLLNKDYLVNPQVTVFIKEYRSKKVYILGAVKSPGVFEFPYEQNLTLMEAITQAGGFERIAALDATRIIRTDEGGEQNINVKITDIIKKGDRSKDILLKPNDIVIVPETFF